MTPMRSMKDPRSAFLKRLRLRPLAAAAVAAATAFAIAGPAGAAASSSRGNHQARHHHANSHHHGNSSKKYSNIKVAILLPGTTSDDAYDANGARAAKAMHKKFGVKVTVATQVSTVTQNQTYAEYASQGYNLVIGWGGQYSSGATTEAAQFPNTDFVVVNSDVKNGTNLGSFDINQGQWQYVGGYLAGELSKSGTVGWIGGQCFTSTLANELGSEDGVKKANPKASFIGTYLGTWTTPTKAEQAANTLISRGADVILGNQNQGWSGVYKAAESHPGTLVIDEWQNDHSQAPSVIASTVLKNQVPYAVKEVRALVHGHFLAKHLQFSLKSAGRHHAISHTSLVPKKDFSKALKMQKQIEKGTLSVPVTGKCP